MAEILRVIHDGRPCFWAPTVDKDDIPIEGRGLFVGPSSLGGMRMAVRFGMDNGDMTRWVGLTETGTKDLMRMLAMGLSEFDGVTHDLGKKP